MAGLSERLDGDEDLKQETGSVWGAWGGGNGSGSGGGSVGGGGSAGGDAGVGAVAQGMAGSKGSGASEGRGGQDQTQPRDSLGQSAGASHAGSGAGDGAGAGAGLPTTPQTEGQGHAQALLQHWRARRRGAAQRHPASSWGPWLPRLVRKWVMVVVVGCRPGWCWGDVGERGGLGLVGVCMPAKTRVCVHVCVVVCVFACAPLQCVCHATQHVFPDSVSDLILTHLA